MQTEHNNFAMIAHKLGGGGGRVQKKTNRNWQQQRPAAAHPSQKFNSGNNVGGNVFTSNNKFVPANLQQQRFSQSPPSQRYTSVNRNGSNSNPNSISFDFLSIFPCDNALTAAGDNSTQSAIISTNHTQTPQSAANPQQPHHTSSITPYSPPSTNALASSSSPLQPNQDPPVNPSPSISNAIPELPPPTHHMKRQQNLEPIQGICVQINSKIWEILADNGED
ncbi:hypothetical protein IMY05_016G0182700 [Salix suchowensis]|nr:hypothetical protein IMY05_016G0182700 [Salix suchowensis]